MATMEYAVVTEAGLALQAKLATGATMTFTKFVTGKGSVSPVLLQKQTDVTEPEQEFLFSDKPYYSEEYPGEVAITMVMTNTLVTKEYFCSQVGIYANDPDDGEILYALLQTGDPFRVPTATDGGGWSTEFEIMVKYGGADAVNIYVNAAGMLTRQAADRRYMKKISCDGKLYEFVRDENGVYLQEIEDTSGEITDVSSISDADWAKLNELFIDTEELAKALENVASKVTVNGKEPDENGEITLGAADVHARPDTWMPIASDVGARPDTWMPTASDVGAFPNGAGSGTIDGTTTSPFHIAPGHYNVVPGISTNYNWPANDTTNLNGTLLVFGKLNQQSTNKGYRVYVYFDNKHRFYYACEWWGNVPTWKNVYSESSITAGTTSLTAGTSALTTGHIYQVYE